MKLFKRLTAVFMAVIVATTMLTVSVSATTKYSVTSKSYTSNSALEFVANLGAGWNLGNAFDAYNCTWLSNELDYESAWCGAKTTKALIKVIKAKGFNTIRIPVSWHDHVDSSYNISDEWMARVKEVVDWCIDEGLYVIINVHHDVAEGYYYPSDSQYSTSSKYMKKVWTQIATTFSSYDEHLIFEAINEPRPVGTTNEWWYSSSNPGSTALEAMENINKLNQVFVDTVRATGGNNKTRYLMVSGFATSTEGLVDGYFEMPTDSASNKIIVTAHIYTNSYNSYVSKLNKLYNTYVANGIPVVIGEFGSCANDSDRVEAAGKTVAEAAARGIACIWWDNNVSTGSSESYGIIDRATGKWIYEDIANVIVANAISSTTKSSSKTTSSSSSSTSTATSTTTLDTPKVSATAGDSKIRLSWDSVSGADYYKVYRYDSSIGKYRCIGRAYKTACTIKDLTNGTREKFIVQAVSTSGAKSKYVAVSITPKAS